MMTLISDSGYELQGKPEIFHCTLEEAAKILNVYKLDALQIQPWFIELKIKGHKSYTDSLNAFETHGPTEEFYTVISQQKLSLCKRIFENDKLIDGVKKNIDSSFNV